MAIRTSYDASVTFGGTDFSDHCTSVTVSDGSAAMDVTCMGNTYHIFRPGLSNVSFSATFKNDQTDGQVSETIRNLLGIVASSSGFSAIVRYSSGLILGTSNPVHTMNAIVDGEVNLMDDKIGEVPEITVKFVPYDSYSVSTTTS
jgi:hypothetical protein